MLNVNVLENSELQNPIANEAELYLEPYEQWTNPTILISSLRPPLRPLSPAICAYQPGYLNGQEGLLQIAVERRTKPY